MLKPSTVLHIAQALHETLVIWGPLFLVKSLLK